MDKIARYRSVIIEILEELAEFSNRSPSDDIRTYTIFDQQHDHYMLLDAGWKAKKRMRSIYAYICIKGGKIWVEEDWTNEGVATYLANKGIQKSEIVLGFKPPEIRPFTEFAVA